MIFAIVGLLLIVVLILRITQMVGGTRTTVTWAHTAPQDQFDPAPGARSANEIRTISAAMPAEWCAYGGTSRPFRLKIRGQTEENFTRITRQSLAGLGPGGFRLLNGAQQAMLMKRISAEAYVADWEGATYPNGNPLPFSLDNLMVLLDGDQFLEAFIMENAHRLSPSWPSTPV